MNPRAPATPTLDVARSARHRDALEKIASCITERDTKICLDLYEQRVLTAYQVFELHFTSYQRARARLLDLHRLGILDRTRPRHRPGSLPWHYILDEYGAWVVAAHRGIERSELAFAKPRTLALIDSATLRHRRGVNSFFSTLTYACRMSGSVHLAEWLGEGRCAARWGGHVIPDGYGRLRTSRRSVGFVLEYDRGTQALWRLENKVERYRLIAAGTDAPDVLLFCFPSEAREANARAVLSSPGITVATTTVPHHQGDPLGRAWWPLASDARVALLDLAGAIERR